MKEKKKKQKKKNASKYWEACLIYHQKEWNQQPEFKYWGRQFAFYLVGQTVSFNLNKVLCLEGKLILNQLYVIHTLKKKKKKSLCHIQQWRMAWVNTNKY